MRYHDHRPLMGGCPVVTSLIGGVGDPPIEPLNLRAQPVNFADKRVAPTGETIAAFD